MTQAFIRIGTVDGLPAINRQQYYESFSGHMFIEYNLPGRPPLRIGFYGGLTPGRGEILNEDNNPEHLIGERKRRGPPMHERVDVKFSDPIPVSTENAMRGISLARQFWRESPNYVFWKQNCVDFVHQSMEAAQVYGHPWHYLSQEQKFSHGLVLDYTSFSALPELVKPSAELSDKIMRKSVSDWTDIEVDIVMRDKRYWLPGNLGDPKFHRGVDEYFRLKNERERNQATGPVHVDSHQRNGNQVREHFRNPPKR